MVGIKNEASKWYFRSKKRKAVVENVVVPRLVVNGVRHLNQGVQCEMCGLDGWWDDPKLSMVGEECPG